MTATVIFAVAAGGALGSVGRYLLSTLLRGAALGFPWGTLAVNVVGGFAMGAITAYALTKPGALSDTLRLGLTTGILGGFTTFSAFSVETLLLWRDGSATAAFANIAANVILSLAACAIGLWLGRQLA
ncbi:fluoride efflux transporter CrcB [uncultured Nevskia sp.]|uniref:fluoride efflux transporter CrcB n=1 Tax=uncultured Nevskia sp. TaxID=228950 RepID=UPI0025F66D15|nr:fluoride efflux transporter CrcB [uncultured Nevskia sp.]